MLRHSQGGEREEEEVEVKVGERREALGTRARKKDRKQGRKRSTAAT